MLYNGETLFFKYIDVIYKVYDAKVASFEVCYNMCFVGMHTSIMMSMQMLERNSPLTFA